MLWCVCIDVVLLLCCCAACVVNCDVVCFGCLFLLCFGCVALVRVCFVRWPLCFLLFCSCYCVLFLFRLIGLFVFVLRWFYVCC